MTNLLKTQAKLDGLKGKLAELGSDEGNALLGYIKEHRHWC